MKVAILHTADAAGPPEDPVIGQIAGALERAGHEARRIVVKDEVQPVVDALTSDRPDLVFNLCESFAGKSALESNVAALLNLLGLRYTGSSPSGLIQAGDKTLTKKVLSFHCILTAKFASVYRGSVDWAADLQFPVIIKPPQEDASLGISQKSIVRDVRGLLEAIDGLQTEFQSAALVEQFIEGREFYVGVLGNVNARALPVIELDFSKLPEGMPKIASYEAKWGDGGGGTGVEFAGSESVFPADVPVELLTKMQKVAVEAFQALKLRDYARIDLRVTDAGEVYVIEVNPNCYLEQGGEFARAAKADGLDFDQLVVQLVELSSARYSR
jgi:D-alanine-D-alanine ligase